MPIQTVSEMLVMLTSNNDCVVNFLDLSLFRTVFFTDAFVADFNADGFVNFLDLGVMKEHFFMDYTIDSPSGVPNACDGSG